MKAALQRLWWALTGPWRCGCCGEIYGRRCGRYCAQDGCVHGRV